MIYLVQYGLPPAVALQTMIWMAQLKIISMAMHARYATAVARQRHLGLPPGEQYRRTLRAGGYRP
jgi:hypothetical protein